jgi:hypothetical protein
MGKMGLMKRQLISLVTSMIRSVIRMIRIINPINPINPIRSSRLRFLTGLVCCLFCIGAKAQVKISPSDTLSPLQIVERYVSPDGFPNKLKFFCCELYQEWFADSTLGQQLPRTVKRECRLLHMDTMYAAVSVWLHDSITSLNYYFYLIKGKNWTLYAIRSLAMTEVAKKEIRSMDTIAPARRGTSYTMAHGHTYDFDYRNLQLWTSPDTNLVAYFMKHRADFEKLQNNLTKKGFYGKQDSLVRRALKDPKIKALATSLLIRDIGYDKKLPGAVFYIIGGISDNTVGYFYQPNPLKVPPMSEKKFILIQPLGNGWYLFKTT